MPPQIEQFVPFFHTRDLEQTSYFYEKLLGLPLVLDQGACHIFQVSDTAFIGFCQGGTAVGDTSGTISGTMITLVSHDVDGWHRYLVDQGVAIEKAPSLNERFNIYQLFVRDPNGYLVEIQTFLDPAWPEVTAVNRP